MTTVTQRGRYGRYLNWIMVILDFFIINLVFVATCFISSEIISEHARVTMLLANISFAPAALWSAEMHTRRAVRMEAIFRRAITIVVFHAMIFITLLWAMKLNHIPVKTMVIFYAIMFVAFPLWWVVSRHILKHYRNKGRNFLRVLIVGSNVTAQRLYAEMNTDAGFGYKVLGFFDDSCPDEIKDNYLGKISDLESYVKANTINEIYYTLSGENETALRTVTKIADDNVIQFYYVPQLSRYLSRGFEMYNIGTVPVLTLRRNPLKKHVNRYVKRAFDVVFSSVVLLFSPIIFIPVAIAIKISSPGPIFFKQTRTGYLGRDFKCWKFRTMKVNADSDKKQAQKDDPRKTKVGDFLRRTSIDELPQFVNVFMGDMSVVGPRPHMLKHTHDYSKLIDKYMVRHAVKPGITGWAQVTGYRGLTEELWQMEKRVEADVWYIENWSFLLDLKIIIRTVINAVKGEQNAF